MRWWWPGGPGRPRENLPVVLGTLVSQTLLNIVALAILGAIMFSSVDLFNGHQNALLFAAIAPVALLVLVLLSPVILRGAGSRSGRLHALLDQARRGMARVRAGLAVFRQPRLGGIATVSQLSAWGLQMLSCYLLLDALGLANRTGFGAAAAVLFAVNVTAVLPATPANLGVFQAACAAVLHTGWHVGYGTGVAYGVILQAVEVTTAIMMGMPALLKEGMSWREVRLRAMHAAPVKLPARPSSRQRSSARRGRSRELSARTPGRTQPETASSVSGSESVELRPAASGPCRSRRSARRPPGARSWAGSPTSSRSTRPAGGGRRSRASTARARPRSLPTGCRPIDGASSRRNTFSCSDCSGHAG